jgi:Flp pilus assembly protein TadG
MTRSREAGQATVEFAAGVLMLLILLVGAIGLGRGVWISNTMAHAAREAARFGSMPTRTSVEIRDYAIERATAIGLTPANVSVTCGICGDPNQPVVVAITYTFSPTTPGISAIWGGGSGIAMSTSSSMYVERGTPPCAS